MSVKKNLLKAGIIVMGLASMLSANACVRTSSSASRKVCKALEEKYGEPFSADAIGDRIDTGHAKLYIHPENNEEIQFVAYIDNKTGEVVDEYIQEKVNYQIESIIKDAFAEQGIEVTSRSVVVTQYEPYDIENKEYTAQSFAEEYHLEDYFVYIVLKDGDYSSDSILKAINFANESAAVGLVIDGYIFKEEQYLECVSDMKLYPDISGTTIGRHSPIIEFGFGIYEGRYTLSEEEVLRQFGGK